MRYRLRGYARPKTKEEVFNNLHHAQLRNVIERIFGVLQQRFHIFDTAPKFEIATKKSFFIVLAALHNFIHH